MRLVALEGQSPNVMGALTAGVQAGKADRADREARQVGQLAASGDMAGARAAALGSGNTDIINMIGQLDAQQRAALADQQDKVGRLAYYVKHAPPQEKQQALAWALGEASKFMPQDAIKQSLPQNINDPGMVDQWADHVIAQAMSLDQMFERADTERSFALKDREFNANESYRNRTLALDERRLDLEAGKAGTATLQTIYDDQGRETKAMVDPQGNIVKTVGGSKSGKSGGIFPDSNAKGAAANIVLQMEEKVRNGETLTEQEKSAYEIAKRELAPTSGQATFQANVAQAKRDVASVREAFFDKDGKFDRGLAASASADIPFSKGKTVRQSIERAVEIILRLRTGAAAPDQEVKHYAKMFIPSALDNDKSAKAKIDALENFFNDSANYMDNPTGMPPGGESPAADGNSEPSGNVIRYDAQGNRIP